MLVANVDLEDEARIFLRFDIRFADDLVVVVDFRFLHEFGLLLLVELLSDVEFCWSSVMWEGEVVLEGTI